jgi:hypothetical protein
LITATYLCSDGPTDLQSSFLINSTSQAENTQWDTLQLAIMAQFFQQAPNSQPYGGNAQNLQFYSSSYGPNTVSGHETPQQASYGYSASAPSPAYPGAAAFNSGFAGPSGVSGRMGEQGGLRTGWLAAFGTEGYDGEPPLLEELGVNFGHIQSKVLTAVP